MAEEQGGAGCIGGAVGLTVNGVPGGQSTAVQRFELRLREGTAG